MNALRNRQKHNFLFQGIPMLLGGDEIGRTQRGNNNAYCQDNEISWYDWSSADTLLEFARRLSSCAKSILCSGDASGFKAARFTAQKSRTSAGSPVRFSAVRSS